MKYFSSLESIYKRVPYFFNSSVKSGVMQASTGEEFEKRYSPNFKVDESLRRQSSTKRKRDEVLRLVSIMCLLYIHLFLFYLFYHPVLYCYIFIVCLVYCH